MKKITSVKLVIVAALIMYFSNCYGQSQAEWTLMQEGSKKALQSFPTISKINNSKLPANSKTFLLDTRTTLKYISDHKSLPSQSEAKRFVEKLNGIQEGFRQNVKVMAQDQDPGSGGPSTSADCAAIYNKCMTDNNCTYSLVCLCCIPCSLEYLACMKDILMIITGKEKNVNNNPVRTNNK
jgi:hypothetical protein